jgi:hypothetical protein
MALDARKRQKKAERRAAKHREKQRGLKRRVEITAARTHAAIGTAPLLRCFMTDDRDQQGLPQVVMGRLLPDGNVACSVFLLDMYCLGVKDAFLRMTTRGEFEHELVDGLESRFGAIELEPACARKLVEGAVDYARTFGFLPHADYAEAKIIFGDIDPAECKRAFEYGKDGKPLFVPGPFDTPARCDRIIRTLSEHCGPDGFKTVAFPQEQQVLPFDESLDFDVAWGAPSEE